MNLKNELLNQQKFIVMKLKLIKNNLINSAAHITGGGLSKILKDQYQNIYQ